MTRNSSGRPTSVKKQHYVPRFYLRRFTQDGSHLFAFDKFDARHYRTRIEDVASERYFYDAPLDPQTGTAGDRDPHQTLEHHLGVLETPAAEALELLITGIEANNAIDPSVRPEIARFLALQVLRTREARADVEQIMELGLAALRREQLAPSLEAWLAEADRPDAAAMTQSGLLLNGQSIRRTADVLLGHIWLVGLNATPTPLWTSDHPVVRVPHVHSPLIGTSGLASPGIEINVPLSPTAVLVLLERTHHALLAPADGRTVSLVPDNITYYNSQQAAQSYRFVYGPSDDFALLRKMREEYPELFRPDRARVEVVAPVAPSRPTPLSAWNRLRAVARRLKGMMR